MSRRKARTSSVRKLRGNMTAHWDIKVNEAPVRHFWLHRAPVIDRASIPVETYSREAIQCPDGDRLRTRIYEYNNGGLGSVQWLNWLEDTAVILIADRSWKDGGAWHAWVAPASGKEPYEVQQIAAAKGCTYPEGDPNEWQAAKHRAVRELCAATGLPIPDDFV